jgi:hypothetical protein
MSKPFEHKPVPFFVGIIASCAEVWEEVRPKLAEIGAIDFYSDKLRFDDFTDYYRPEMGGELLRFWAAFDAYHPVEKLVDFKLLALELENAYSTGDNRSINIDPGYMTEAKVILASFKDFSHRIYLSRSVFADMQLIYRDGRWSAYPWTFADYKSSVAQAFFCRLRGKYRENIRKFS